MQNIIHTSYSSDYLPSELKQSENNIFSNLTNGLTKLTQFILNNPGKVITLGLAGQAIGSSALGKPQNQSSVGNNNLTQEFMGNPYLADSLATIEQRVAPALNLTWLNQTDAKQIDSIPAWLSTNDTHVNERSHRTKREHREETLKTYLLTHDVCLKNVYHNYEYLFASGYRFNGKRGRSSRHVFTWTPGDRVIQAPWRFETYDNGNTFYIKNQKWGEYLYARGYKYNSNRRFLATWIGDQLPTTTGRWKIKLLTTEGRELHIALWNLHYNEPLYAAGDSYKYDDKRRRVFTWVPEEMVMEARWKVENCDFSRRRREIPDRLEDSASLSEKENPGYLDKTATKPAFFQIKQPDQVTVPISDFNSDAENQVTSSQLNRTTIS